MPFEELNEYSFLLLIISALGSFVGISFKRIEQNQENLMVWFILVDELETSQALTHEALIYTFQQLMYS